MSKGRILFADDEERMRRLVSDFLKSGGYDVVCVSDGREAVDTFDSDTGFDIVILDIMMPRMDGLSALKRIKQIKEVPVILLTAKGGEYDELEGFRLGTDEYITKPFSPKILLARVDNLLRRLSKDSAKGPKDSFGILIDPASRVVSIDGEALELTGKEYELLLYFTDNPGVVCTRDMIIEAVWDSDFAGDERTVDTHVKKLRAKLKEKGSLIKTVWAVGYKFEGP